VRLVRIVTRAAKACDRQSIAPAITRSAAAHRELLEIRVARLRARESLMSVSLHSPPFAVSAATGASTSRVGCNARSAGRGQKLRLAVL